MTRSISLLLLSVCLLFFLTIYATANDEPDPYEEIFPEVGYKTVDEALDDLEQHFKQKPKLPLRIPPISFTHQFGRFSDLDDDISASFEVKFINEQFPENHYKIDVRPIENAISINEQYVMKTFELKNGNVATYMTISGFHVLVLERDGWQYMLSVDKRVSDKVTPEILTDIANSIDY